MVPAGGFSSTTHATLLDSVASAKVQDADLIKATGVRRLMECVIDCDLKRTSSDDICI